MSQPHNRWICLFLIAANLLAYWQVRDCEFVNYDDEQFVFENPHIRNGLTWDGIRWAFSGNFLIDGISQTAYWAPVTHLSHMCDFQLYGPDPAGHHLTSLWIHILNTLLLFLIFNSMTKDGWQSAMVAALFAIHPMNVESVAWIVERKGILSTFFGLLTIGAYVRYVRAPSKWRYWMVFLPLATGLMAKVTLVTWPVLLLLLDIWPLKRVRLNPFEPRTWRTALIEKSPLFALSALASLQAVFYIKNFQRPEDIIQLSMADRISNAAVAYAGYLWKTIYPHDLAVFYPHPGHALPAWQIVLSLLLLAGISIWVFSVVRDHPCFMVGWLWYLVVLLPMIGIVQVGKQAMADRYAYVPLIGIFVIIIWGVFKVFSRQRSMPVAFITSAMAALLSLGVVTWNQLKYWKNSMTLFQHTLEVTSDNAFANNNLGVFLYKQGRLDEAIAHFSEAVRINTARGVSARMESYNLANTLMKQGKVEEAAIHFTDALEIKPDRGTEFDVLCHALLRQGNRFLQQDRFDEAAERYAFILKIKPDFVEGHANLGTALLKLGKVDEAIAHFREGIRLYEDDPMALNNLAWILATHRNPKFRDGAEAVLLAKRACEITRHHQPVYLRTLAAAHAEAGQFKEAIETSQMAYILASTSHQNELASQIQTMMQLYRNSQFYRQVSQ